MIDTAAAVHAGGSPPPSGPEPDARLLARVAEGDEQAFATLYDRHAGRAYALALRVVRDPHRAEEAVQDGFLGVWRLASRYDRTRSAPSTWINVLVHRRAVEIVRYESSRQTTSLDVTAPDAPAAGSVETDVVVRAERRKTQAALAQLSDRQRTVLELAYYAGLTQSEIAAQLRIPVGTVKSRTSGGLQRLGSLLHLGGPARLSRRAGGPREPNAAKTTG